MGINARLLYSPEVRGWNRYTINLISELSQLDVALYLYTDRPIDPFYLSKLRPGSFQIRQSKPMNYFVWQEFWLGKNCIQDGVDVFHSPSHYGLPRGGRYKKILTLHDAIDQNFYSPAQSIFTRWSPFALKIYYNQWIARQRANLFITVSQFSKNDLINAFSLEDKKIRVIYEAADSVFHLATSANEPSKAISNHLIAAKYVLYVGGLERRKNLPFLIDAFSSAQLKDTDLVIVGAGSSAHLPTSDSRIKFLGFVSDPDLAALYSRAQCFVLPSLYEGFGLPLCEAMACGCPTLAAQSSCLPEILGSGGESFPLTEKSRLIELLKKIASDSGFRESLRERARERSKHFSWKNTASETLSAYQSLLN